MPSFHYCFNTSTIRGQQLSLVEEIEIAAQAGYQAIEPWIDEIEAYVQQGGTLPVLKKRIEDLGLTVESAIGFAEWIVNDDARRAQGMECARHEMDLVRQIGGKRIASPPSGAADATDIGYFQAADRYRALLELGDQIGVVPQLEIWGFSKTLNRLGEAMLVAIESQHPRACVLLDVYHLYRGGSDFMGLRMLQGSALGVFHMNDYPASPPRDLIADSDRVFPGDGVAPLREIVTSLHQIGYNGYLSIELFNESYWQQDALIVARTALEKTQAIVRQIAN